jgi:uncharacterized protein
MLTIDLARLEREGSLEIRGSIPSDDPSWEGTELRFSAPLSVSGQVVWIRGGEVLARLQIRGTLDLECRRCLESVEVEVAEPLELLYAPQDEATEEPEADIRPLPLEEGELDLKEAIREEVILSQSHLVLCRPDCKGLCPSCGTNLNENRCECSPVEEDPRWDTLRALKEGRE